MNKEDRKEYYKSYFEENKDKIRKSHRDYYYKIKNGDPKIYRAWLDKKKKYQQAYRDRLKAKKLAAKMENEIES